MKATELRIGNLVYSYNGIGTDITVVDFNVLRQHGILSPIPLTEEWLAKLGFELDINCYVKDIAIYGNEELGFRYNASYFEDDNLIEIKHVHQLQNIYFALTNTELTINL